MDSLLAPIDSKAAWTGAELASSEAWQRQLTKIEIHALEHAAEATLGFSCPGFGPRAFQVPALQPLYAWMAQQLEHGPGAVRIYGLPVKTYTHEEKRRIFWGFCVNLGTPVYQTSAGETLGEVKDETGTGAALDYNSGKGKLISARTVARSTGPLRFHTDKCDLLSLMCASNAIDGGISKIASSVTIHNEMARRRPDLLRVFYQPFWRMRPEDEEGDRPDRVFPLPVFARASDGGFTSQYSRTYINQAQEVPGVPALTEEQTAAMDLLHEIGEETCLFAPFEEGAMQFMTQHVTYHGRTGFQNDETSGRSRVLLRTWLAPSFSRRLPDGHAVQWGDTRPGALRGGALVGRSAITESAA
jgi:hypothetical protein